MIHDPKLYDEQARLSALRRYEILDTTPEAPFDEVTQLVQRVLSVPVASVTLVDEKRSWFKSMLGMPICEMAREGNFCARAITQRDPMVIADATTDARFRDNPTVTGEPGIRAYMGVPIETPDGYNIGALCAVDFRPRQFQPHEVAMMVSFSRLVQNQLELRQIATSDALTGALTRRALIEAASKEIARKHRYGIEASLVVFDLDHFKKVNDSRGHAAGDAVLKAVSALCHETIRDNDVLGRLGGEEFALLLPSTGAAGAMELAERLRARIEALAIESGDAVVRVTASFGVNALGGHVTEVAQWLTPADACLYQAKHEGRNRVCCARQGLPA